MAGLLGPSCRAADGGTRCLDCNVVLLPIAGALDDETLGQLRELGYVE